MDEILKGIHGKQPHPLHLAVADNPADAVSDARRRARRTHRKRSGVHPDLHDVHRREALREVRLGRERQEAGAAIEAREKGTRLRQTEEERKATELGAQRRRSADENFAILPQHCDWGCKRDSKGKRMTWKGYKLHVCCTDTPDWIVNDLRLRI